MSDHAADYGTFKTRTLILLAVQCGIALFLLVGAIPFSLNSDITFSHSYTCPLILILLSITFIWFISTLLALVVVIRDQKRYLRFHICLNTVILVLYFLKLFILLFTNDTTTIALCIFVNLINFLSVYYEFKLIGAY